MAAVLAALSERWLGVGLPDNTPIELTKMAATLRGWIVDNMLSIVEMSFC